MKPEVGKKNPAQTKKAESKTGHKRPFWGPLLRDLRRFRATVTIPRGNGDRRTVAESLQGLAEALGFEVEVRDLSRRCGIVGDATSSSRQEGGEPTWRDHEKDIVCVDRTNTDDNGESNLLDQMGDELWRRFQRKKKQKRQQRRPARGSQGE